ncbi:unnamed protein product [Linum trigynum]|uniref:Major facilitator superfamily (MFS) profile domain-containing protein n=1 Tax=Linum trigynum TaxID=586398 RepID=A0AAV2FXH4_9ROSI
MPGLPLAESGCGPDDFPAKLTLQVVLCTIIAAFGGFMFGYDVGISGGVTAMDSFLKPFFPHVYIKKHTARSNNYCKYNDHYLQLFTSSLYLAAIVASFVASLVCKRLGRRPAMQIASVFFFTGAAINAAALNLPMLIIGRLLLGAGVGFGNQTVPLFISEIAPAKYRGGLNICFQLLITLGILSANIVNFITSKVHPYGWRISLGGAAVPAVVLLIGSFMIVETPTSLLERGETDKARSTLKKIRGVDNVGKEYAEIREAVELASQVQHPFRSLRKRYYRPQLICGTIIQVFQQLTGISVITFYSPALFQTMGFGEHASLFSAVVINTIKPVCTIVAILVVDRFGRRALLIEASVQLFIAECAIGAILATHLDATSIMERDYAVAVICLICVFLSGFAWSWGPLGWLIPSEIYPLETRTAGFFMAVSMNMLVTFMVAQTFLTMLCHMRAGAFFFFAGCLFVMGTFAVVLLPETKGVPIDEMIGRVWKKHWFWKRPHAAEPATLPSFPTFAGRSSRKTMNTTGGCLYKDPNAPVEARVKDLLSRMTLEEKLAQMIQLDRVVADSYFLRDLAVGSVLSTGGSAPFENALASDWADMVDGFQKLALESRLGIPILYGADAVHGNNCVYGATVFPHNVGLGATRDADLVKSIGIATALEVRASGIQYTFAPCVAVSRDPRWGRCYESYSEDTNIVRKMTSIVAGLQGQPPEGHPHGYPFIAGRNNIVACAKHFVGDGGTHRGLNEGNTMLSYEDLERIHMAPYLDCIAQGVGTIMASYSSWNGSKLHTDRFLLTEVLKDKLGFKGFVISDWEALNRLSEPRGSNYRRCVASAVNAGIDMVMVGRKYNQFVEDIISLAKSGEIPTSRINDAVERILRVKFIAGLFEYPFADRSLLGTVGCKLHRNLAQEAVRKSLVLLKNGKESNKPFLPLDKNAKKILVAGTHADNLGYQCGGWTIAWYGLGGRITIGTTILDAVRKAVGEKTEIVFEEYPSPETLSGHDFSYAIVAVGESPYAEFTGDNAELVIPMGGRDILSLVSDRVPTLAIVVSGRPLVVEPHILEKTDALVAAWLPGTEGDGITDVIFGDHDFKGQLPVTWFKEVKQLPMNHGENNEYDPLFPFGFGLTYE